ncbi:MAG: hypothetical protein COU07_01685 [Candidatus Harrisonbacteria bacterium CG10_big_fil_rev_8_21_14_0_10_40_38]|uniref:Glycosyl transferase family 1 n=1 Tax=Candidatus Harrisonbacteria bacterium CG10_big_fil_rev_8_21_14_0_10_40_38 TaxID=1974583 RepID=A0A2H0UT56_9BACT|nr:MAG: hypothetical protein COU07_01685 [Candidatus Harrisonbacteria bacterium CG10_big_fil_rev_8_21_14_0_10_40_38]
MAKNSSNTVVYLSTYPPRECGIATFTQDLTNAFDKRFNPVTRSRIAAINEHTASFYNYGPKTIDQITAPNLDQYVALAERLNRNDGVKVVSIQHEFGLFGGDWGDYLMPFLQVIKKPVVTTFHSVLPHPDDYVKKVVQFISDKSKAVVVMNDLSKTSLEKEYGVPKSKVFVVPHGIPQVSFESPEKMKEELGLGGKLVLSTFGLLSPGKGIEYAIRSLPPLVKQFPNLLYLVLGATHPVIQRNDGEAYRNFLLSEVNRLNLKNNVKFYNRYLGLEEILAYLKATDVYVSPSIDPRQSVSGTLSYALGCGRPVISTKTEYAKHLVSDFTGVLVPVKSAKAFTKALQLLLTDEKMRYNMSQAAYEATRKMVWPNVAGEYFRIFNKFASLKAEERKLPEIKFDHLSRLTDDFGIIQHARYSRPEKRFGYSTDDNTRALIASAKHYGKSPSVELVRLMGVYLDFLKFVQQKDGSFANIVTSKHSHDGTKDEDVYGRAMWALGYTASRTDIPEEISNRAKALFLDSFGRISKLTAPRAIAFTISGLYHYFQRFPEIGTDLISTLAEKQVKYFNANASLEWQWFEDQLTYSNSRLSESLFYAFDVTGNKKYLDIAEKSLEFLSNVTFEKDHYSPIGAAGWYSRDKKRSYYDQQPEDTASMVETKLVAYGVTHKKKYLDDALTAFHWFLGKNHLRQVIYDEATGGCYDGVAERDINLNQGAESTACYLLARLALNETLSTEPAES